MRTERGSNCHLGFSTVSFSSIAGVKTNVIHFGTSYWRHYPDQQLPILYIKEEELQYAKQQYWSKN